MTPAEREQLAQLRRHCEYWGYAHLLAVLDRVE